MIEISLNCAQRSCSQPFLVQQDGEDWLFWCQHCAHVFVVDAAKAAALQADGHRSCSCVNPNATCQASGGGDARRLILGRDHLEGGV